MNCYNNAATLHEALQSVVTQTFTDWEVIFWDNGSDDDSINIAKGFNSEKIHCFQDCERISLGHSRNQALAKVSGKYIAFLDCDDIWLPTKLEKQVSLMESDAKLALVCTDTENFYTDNSVYKPPYKPPYKSPYKSLGRVFTTAKPHRGKVFAKLIQGQWISMSSVMLRRACLNDEGGQHFDITLTICEEAELFYRLAHEWDFDYVDAVLTKRRIHDNNTTFTRFDELAAETEYILKKQYELHADFDKNYPDIAKALKHRAAFQRSIALWRNGQGKAARKELGGISLLKARLFYVVSFLPPSVFPHCVCLYFKLAKYINR